MIETFNWDNHGLVGMIIGALFISLFYGINLVLTITREFRDERKEILEVHKQERKEWKSEAESRASRLEDTTQKNSDRMETVLNNLTNVIRENHRERP